jgi:hypothetical protein
MALKRLRVWPKCVFVLANETLRFTDKFLQQLSSEYSGRIVYQADVYLGFGYKT